MKKHDSDDRRQAEERAQRVRERLQRVRQKCQHVSERCLRLISIPIDSRTPGPDDVERPVRGHTGDTVVDSIGAYARAVIGATAKRA